MTDTLKILFRDEHMVAVHKPPGLLVHRTGLERGETRFALQILHAQLGAVVWPVHRLDRGTSGVLLFALDRETLTMLSRSFEQNAVDKTYLAVVRGWPAEHGVIDYALSRQYDDPADIPDNGPAPPQEAVTEYERLATVELPVALDRYATSRYALLRVHPKTGRRHQIRRHLKHIAHPVIGDATHGKGNHNRMFQERFGCHRMLLACLSIQLKHPYTGQSLLLQTDLDDDFQATLRALLWHWSPDSGQDCIAGR